MVGRNNEKYPQNISVGVERQEEVTQPGPYCLHGINKNLKASLSLDRSRYDVGGGGCGVMTRSYCDHLVMMMERISQR